MDHTLEATSGPGPRNVWGGWATISRLPTPPAPLGVVSASMWGGISFLSRS
jgi:hypothetical protein